jgi:hypothetical protein
MKHLRMTLTLLAPLAILAIAAPALSARSAQTPTTADAVVAKHLEAEGGRAALSKLTSRHATGTIVLTIPGAELGGPVELFLKAPNKSRAVMSLDLAAVGAGGTLEVQQIFDGTAGWAINPMQGDQPITGTQLENMKDNTFPTPFMAPLPSGSKLTMLPNETVDGKSWIVLQLTRPSGNNTKIYFDPETYLIGRSVSMIDNPETGAKMQLVSSSSDYRTVDGVKVPFKIVNASDIQTITIVLTKVEHNVPMDDAMFSKSSR